MKTEVWWERKGVESCGLKVEGGTGLVATWQKQQKKEAEQSLTSCLQVVLEYANTLFCSPHTHVDTLTH